MIRWLVAGAGQAGQVHLAAIARTRGAMAVGIVDPSPGADLGPLPCFADLATAIASTKPNAVVLAAPNDTHVDLARTAIAADIPVLCEKPVGRIVTDAEAILAMAAARNIAVGVVLNQRALVATRWIGGLIATGKLAPRSITFTGDVSRLGGWHMDVARAGGGAVRTLGIHSLDLLVWWLGTPRIVTAALTGAPAETAFKIALEFASGCRGTVDITATRAVGAGPVRCVIDAGAARVVTEAHRIVEAEGLPPPPDPEPHDPRLIYGPGHGKLIAEATANLAAGKDFPIPLRAALPTLRLIDEVYAHAR